MMQDTTSQDTGRAGLRGFVASAGTSLRYPRSVAVGPGGSVYSGCCRPGGVERFTFKGGALEPVWGADGGKVSGVAVRPDGTLYATVKAEEGTGVRVLDPEGDGLKSWWWGSSSRTLINPQGIAGDSAGRFYLVECNLWGGDSLADRNRVIRCGPDGEVQATWGETGQKDGQLNLPVGIAIGPDGLVYVADAYNCRVQVFDSAGRFVSTLGGPGEFNCPQDVALDESGRLYVADTYNNRVQVFGPDGSPLGQWGAEGTEPGRFWLPCGIAVDGAGLVYVADTMNHRIQVFDPDLVSTSRTARTAQSGDQSPAPAGRPGALRLVEAPSGSVEASLRDMAREQGASHFGIADLTRAWQAWPESFEESGRLLTGIAIGVREDDALLDGLPVTDDPCRTAHYVDKIAPALAIGDRIVRELTARGYRAHRLGHPPQNGPTGLFKLTARFAGLGWIGKNRLLITPDAGPRVALAAVLTDAPLQPTATQPLPDGCGDCTRCLDACPVHAYSYEPFGETDSMEGFDTSLCVANRGIINPSGWGLCGLCVASCPFGQQEGRDDA